MDSRRVLIVHRNPTMRRLAAEFLKKSHIPYAITESGIGALKAVHNGSIGLVITSTAIGPAMSGTELVEEMCLMHPHVPVVVWSSIERENLSLPRNAYYVRMGHPQELVERVMLLLGRPQQMEMPISIVERLRTKTA